MFVYVLSACTLGRHTTLLCSEGSFHLHEFCKNPFLENEIEKSDAIVFARRAATVTAVFLGIMFALREGEEPQRNDSQPFRWMAFS